jgi:hypothetical protein
MARLDRAAAAGKPKTSVGPFEWSDSNRLQLLTVLVDTGDLLAAQAAVGCTPNQYNREVARNSSFSEAVKEAKREASGTLEMLATHQALRGNDRLLSLLLNRSENDLDSLRKVSDDELCSRLERWLKRAEDKTAGTRPSSTQEQPTPVAEVPAAI